jgi:hypothetical protein
MWLSTVLIVKIQNGPHGILKDLGETDSWRSLKSKMFNLRYRQADFVAKFSDYRWCHCYRRLIIAGVAVTGGKLITGVTTRNRWKSVSRLMIYFWCRWHQCEQLIADAYCPWIFVKSWNGPNRILRGPGETDSWKTWKSRVRFSLIMTIASKSAIPSVRAL